jgi:hypothetical protein
VDSKNPQNITVSFYDGFGRMSGRFLSKGEFVYIPKPAGIMDMGVAFE